MFFASRISRLVAIVSKASPSWVNDKATKVNSSLSGMLSAISMAMVDITGTN